MSDVFYHFLLIPLRQDLSLKLVLVSLLGWKPASPTVLSLSTSDLLGLQAFVGTPMLLCGCWNLVSIPHDLRANTNPLSHLSGLLLLLLLLLLLSYYQLF